MLPQRVKKVYVSQDVFCTVEAPCHYALKIKSIKKSSVGISKCLRSLAAHPGSVVEQQLHLSTVNQGTQVQFPNPVGGGGYFGQKRLLNTSQLHFTLLIQKTMASSRSKGSSLEALKVEKRFTQATTRSMLIISTV